MLTISQVLNAKSERSVEDQVNHNCLINKVSYSPEYGITFELYKFTTCAQINIDIDSQESCKVVLSQGRGYPRFKIDSKILWELRPSVRKVIQVALNELPDLLRNFPDQNDSENRWDSVSIEECVFDCLKRQQDTHTYKSAFTAEYASNFDIRTDEEQERQEAEEVVLVIE